MSWSDHAATFAALHVPGDPLVLFNIWDVGSARAVAKAGAKALATGSASVAGALGAADGEDLPMDFALDNAARITSALDLPLTLDFEGGYSADPETGGQHAVLAKHAGAVGINFEDQVIGGDGLYDIATQSARITAIREAAGSEFWINARTDIFLKAKPDTHDAAMVETALERARAYADAGGSSIFAPGLRDPALITAFCEGCPLPVNIMAYPGMSDRAMLASCGVARISHGPFPWMDAMKAVGEAASAAMK